MKTDFGDLRSAVHAEQGKEQRVKDVLASYGGDPQQALQYVKDHGVLNVVSMWKDGFVRSKKPRNIRDVFTTHFHFEPHEHHYDKGAPLGFIVIADANILLLEGPTDQRVYLQWALEHVRKPMFEQYCKPWLNKARAVKHMNVPLLYDVSKHMDSLITVAHPKYIAGEMDQQKWIMCTNDAYHCFEDYWQHIRDTTKSTGHVSWAMMSLLNTSLHHTINNAGWANHYAKGTGGTDDYAAHLQSWLIDRYGWNAWGGVQ